MVGASAIGKRAANRQNPITHKPATSDQDGPYGGAELLTV
jgi:hypothetical protein